MNSRPGVTAATAMAGVGVKPQGDFWLESGEVSKPGPPLSWPNCCLLFLSEHFVSLANSYISLVVFVP